MDLKEIAAISGKEGLYKIVKPTRTGMIVESLSENKARFAVGSTGKVSVLEDISIYVDGERESVPLAEIFRDIHKKFDLKIPVSGKSSPEELKDFLEAILPEYDRERVYLSDIKKLVLWYELLCHTNPELFTTQSTEEQKTETKTTKNRSVKKKPESVSATADKSKDVPKTSVKKPKKKPQEGN